MSNIMQDLHTIGLNPFAVTLLAESVLKSPIASRTIGKPQGFFFPVQRGDCAGWAGVRMTVEAVPTTETEAERAARDHAAAPDLDHLRDALLAPPPIERDAMGLWCNPAMPVLDEAVNVQLFLLAFGLDCEFVMAESQVEMEAYDAMCEAADYRAWTPVPPGEGWTLLSIHDTEDGPIASYVRPLNQEAVKDTIAVIAAEHAGQRTWAARRLQTANAEIAGLRRGIDAVRATIAAEPFQQRVQPWMLACFGAEIAGDQVERNHRFVEEALELAQACGCTASEAHQLVDYVFGRPVGEKAQEVGGVMVTLAALCLAQGLDMHRAGEVELARIWTKVEQIRAKQAAKPKPSPLPEAAAPTQPTGLSEKVIIALETVVDIPGKRPKLGYTVLADEPVFETHEQASASLRERQLPIGWVRMNLAQLCTGLRAALSTHPKNKPIALDAAGQPKPKATVLEQQSVQLLNTIKASPAFDQLPVEVRMSTDAVLMMAEQRRTGLAG